MLKKYPTLAKCCILGCAVLLIIVGSMLVRHVCTPVYLHRRRTRVHRHVVTIRRKTVRYHSFMISTSSKSLGPPIIGKPPYHIVTLMLPGEGRASWPALMIGAVCRVDTSEHTAVSCEQSESAAGNQSSLQNLSSQRNQICSCTAMHAHYTINYFSINLLHVTCSKFGAHTTVDSCC